jgi:ribosomal protein S18 acetylase RimI-like enzyme
MTGAARGIALVEAAPAHAEIIAALHAATIAAERGGGWGVEWVARILALPGAFAVLALAEEPAGFALCLPAGDAVDLVAVGVVVARRREGIARRLVEHCAARAKAAGAERLMLEVAADNAVALALYHAVGFAEVGRRPGYYGAGRARPAGDAIVLARSL